jgi:hypothetical protein
MKCELRRIIWLCPPQKWKTLKEGLIELHRDIAHNRVRLQRGKYQPVAMADAGYNNITIDRSVRKCRLLLALLLDSFVMRLSETLV